MPDKQTLAEAFNYIEPEFIEQKRFERYITSVDQMPPLPDGQNVTIDYFVNYNKIPDTQKRKEAKYRRNDYLLKQIFDVASRVLNKRQWRIFSYKYLFNLSFDEIRKQTQLKPSQISDSLNRSKTILKRIFTSVSLPEIRNFKLLHGVNNLPRGVSMWPNGSYYAQIKIDQVAIHLGTFKTIAEAHDAFKWAENIRNSNISDAAIRKRIKNGLLARNLLNLKPKPATCLNGHPNIKENRYQTNCRICSAEKYLKAKKEIK